MSIVVPHLSHSESFTELLTKPSRLEYTTRRLMAVDDEADITFTLKKELEQSRFSLDVFNDPIFVQEQVWLYTCKIN
jgi:hypothetical protein